MARKCRLDYKWVIAAACFLLGIVGLGLCSGNRGLYLVATTEALNISRSAYAVNDSMRYIAAAIANMFFGTMVMKFGPRKLIGAGLGILILSCVFYAIADGIVGLYVGGLMLGIGLTFAGQTMIGYVVKLWFVDHQGAILGALLSANAIGAAISAPWFSSVIYGGEAFGYRKAYWGVALILLVSGILLMLMFRDKPKTEVAPSVAGIKKQKIRVWEGNSYAQEIRKPYFYIICGFMFLMGLAQCSSVGVSAAHMKDQGLNPDFVALSMSVYALALAVSKLLIGNLSDRKGLRFATLTCNGAALGMVIMLISVSDSGLGKAMAMSYAVLAGLALPFQTVLMPLLAGDLFCDRDYGKVLGIFTALHSVGFLLGNQLANLCFDLLGTYRHILVVAGLIVVVVTAAFVFAYQKMTAAKELKEMKK